MKKTGLLNQPLSAVIAGLGHNDTLCVADAGLPIPASTQRIDLAVSAGIPTFFDTLRAVLSEMKVERAIIAQEMTERSQQTYQQLLDMLAGVPVVFETHEDFKRLTASCRAVARTGEFTPYANVILVAGVVF